MVAESNPAPAGSDRFLEHWRALAAGGLIPTLTDFLDQPDPRFAPRLFIVDVDGDGRMPVRLIGTRYAEYFGEVTGRDFLDLVAAEIRQFSICAHALVCATPCGWLTQARAITTSGREVLAETVTLPLLRRGRVCSVVKCGMVVEQLAFREAVTVVQSIHDHRWIDIGAGIPADTELSALPG